MNKNLLQVDPMPTEPPDHGGWHLKTSTSVPNQHSVKAARQASGGWMRRPAEKRSTPPPGSLAAQELPRPIRRGPTMSVSKASIRFGEADALARGQVAGPPPRIDGFHLDRWACHHRVFVDIAQRGTIDYGSRSDIH